MAGDEDDGQGSGRTQLRWFVLILSSLATLGSYYCYDNPSALHDQFKQYFSTTSYAPNFEMYFNLLYTVYSIPNCVLPLVGGVLSDYFGIRFMLVVFASLIAFGQLVCVIGVFQNSLVVVLVGRVFFGLGGESLSVIASALVSSWFAGKELALALGIQLSFSRLGSVLNDILSPQVDDQFGLAAALILGLVLTLFSVLMAMILACMRGDEKDSSSSSSSSSVEVHHFAEMKTFTRPSQRARRGMVPVLSDISDTGESLHSESEDNESLASYTSFSDTSSRETSFSDQAPLAGGLGLYHSHPHQQQQQQQHALDTNGFSYHNTFDSPVKSTSYGSTSQLTIDTSPDESSIGGDGNGALHGAGQSLTSKYLATPHVGKRRRNRSLAINSDGTLSPSTISSSCHPSCSGISNGFWILGAHCMCVYGSIFPFNNISSAVLRDEYGGDKAGINVGVVQGVPFAIAALITPIIGILVDTYGHRVEWMTFSSVLLMIAHAIIYYGPTYRQEGQRGESIDSFEAFFINNPIPSFVMIGLSYSVVAGVVWPSVVCVVEPEKTATAFGLLTSFQNTAQALVPIAVATLMQDYGSENFQPPEGLFFLISTCAFLLALCLWIWDSRYGGWALYDPTKGTPVTTKTPKLDRRESRFHRSTQSSLHATSYRQTEESVYLLEGGHQVTELNRPQYQDVVYPAEI